MKKLLLLVLIAIQQVSAENEIEMPLGRYLFAIQMEEAILDVASADFKNDRDQVLVSFRYRGVDWMGPVKFHTVTTERKLKEGYKYLTFNCVLTSDDGLQILGLSGRLTNEDDRGTEQQVIRGNIVFLGSQGSYGVGVQGLASKGTFIMRPDQAEQVVPPKSDRSGG